MSAPVFDDSLLAKAFELYATERYYSPEALELERQVTFSPEFEARMEKLFRRQKNPYYLVFNTVGKRVAAVIVAILVSAAVTTFSVKALREPFVRFVTEVFEKFTSIVFVADEEETFEFIKTEPQYISDGYVVDSVIEDPMFYVIQYKRDGFEPILYKQQRNRYATTDIDTQNTAYKHVDIGEYEGVLYTNKDRIKLVFCNSDYRFLLQVPIVLGEEEAIRIAESIAEIP